MKTVAILLAIATLLYALWLGHERGVVTFADASPKSLCAHACAPEGVASVALEIDRQGVLRGYECVCSP